jgi:hypothetical protein
LGLSLRAFATHTGCIFFIASATRVAAAGLLLLMSRIVLFSWLVSAYLSLFAILAHGQAVDYKIIEPTPQLLVVPSDSKDEAKAKSDRIRNTETQVNDVLVGKATIADKQTIFDTWFTQYVFAKMTLYTPEDLAKIPKDRERFILKNLMAATSPETHKHLVELTLAEMSKIVNEEYHPAVRYNAMLIIGELNTTEMVRTGASPAPPETHVPALQFMLKTLENAKQEEYLRIGALVGINRHAQMEALYKNKPANLRISNADWDRMRKLTLGLVQSKAPQAGRDLKSHNWLRRRAMETMGWLASARPDAELVQEFLKTLRDPKEDRGVRTEAAAAIGIANYSNPVVVKPRETATLLVNFLMEGINSDLDYLHEMREYSEEQASLYDGTFGTATAKSPEFGGGLINTGDIYTYRIEPIKRRLKHEIGVVMYSLRGNREYRRSSLPPTAGLLAYLKKKEAEKPLTDAEKKEAVLIEEISKELDNVRLATTKSDTTDLYFDNMEEKIDALAALVAINVPEAAPAATPMLPTGEVPATTPAEPKAAAPDLPDLP